MNSSSSENPPPRLYLSPPHMSGEERALVMDTFDSNWIAPLGPHVDAFEAEFAKEVDVSHAVALSSGTAALHLALIGLNINTGDDVLTSTFTFSASVNPIRYLNANPVLIDSEAESWNMDPNVLEETLEARARRSRLPAAVVVVHLYGQSADMDAIGALCEKHGVPLVEDAAEALGAKHRGRQPGTFGRAGIFSFNGNKVITTSGGGMLVTNDEGVARHARKLATQAREPAPHYQHTEIGYNYRLSNVLAAIGRGQLRVLRDRVDARRKNFAQYVESLGDVPGLSFQPEASWGLHSRWLTCMVVDPELFGADREQVRLALEAENIESRPLWKPMHLQPVFADCEMVGGTVAEDLFERGLCLPSGSSMSAADHARVVSIVRNAQKPAKSLR